MDIERSRSGGIDGSEVERILLGNCKEIKGTEDCKVVAEENCRTGGSHGLVDDNCRYASHSQHIVISATAIVQFTDRRDHCPN